MPNVPRSRRKLLAATAFGAAGIGVAAVATTSYAGEIDSSLPYHPARGNGERVKAKLAELGLTLPQVAAPVGAYVPAVHDGGQVYSSGQLPTVGGNLTKTGRVGAEVTQDEAIAMAQTAALNAIAAIGTAIDLDRIKRIVKVVGYISSAPGFFNQSAVLNGASDLFGKVWGDAGKHSRSAVGAAVLPKNSPLEIEVVVSLL